MSKERRLVIECCGDCKHWNRAGRAFCMNEQRWIEDISKIPDWCLLKKDETTAKDIEQWFEDRMKEHGFERFEVLRCGDMRSEFRWRVYIMSNTWSLSKRGATLGEAFSRLIEEIKNGTKFRR